MPRLLLLPLALLMLAAIAIGALFYPRSDASAGSGTTVTVGDTWFCAPEFQNGVCVTTISQGDTVTWDFSGAEVLHTSRECGATCNAATPEPLWNSGLLEEETTFSFTFDTPGSYLYRCEVHPIPMRGRIDVLAGETPVPTTPPGATPTRTPTPSVNPGDVDCSGGVTSIDAALVLQLSAGLLQSLNCAQNADWNNDGQTNSLDAALILQRVAGFI